MMTREEAWDALSKQRSRKLNPPRLMRAPLSARIHIVTHGKQLGHDGEMLIEAQTKYDVTDQFNALAPTNDENTVHKHILRKEAQQHKTKDPNHHHLDRPHHIS